jgi:O-antigen ligase
MKYLNLRYIFIFIVCIWAPLQSYVLKIDGAQLSLLFLAVLICAIYLNVESFRTNLLSTPFMYWFIWVIYAFTNTLTLGGYLNLPNLSFFTMLFIPLVVIWFINAVQYQDRKYIFNIIIIGLFIRIFLNYIFESSNLQNFGDRLGGTLNPNEIAVSAVVLICFIFLKYFHNEIRLSYMIILISFPVFIIILAGSRGSFGALLLLIIAFFVIIRTEKRWNNFAILLFSLILIYCLLTYILANTNLGTRLSETFSQGENFTGPKSNSTLLNKFGDRGLFYQLGYDIFLTHPLRGIGLGNFIKYSGSVVQHSEYMIQLCELGLIGSTLFILFYGYIGRNLFYLRRILPIERKLIEAYIGVFCVILFLALSLFQYTLVVFFLLSGSLIGFVRDLKSKISNYD